MLDLFNLSILALIVTIVVFIVRAIRLTNASIEKAGRDIPLSRPDVVRRVAEEIRSRDVRCPRCGQTTYAMLGTANRYRCEDEICYLEFEGPAHFPSQT
jgi:tRNA(Ile2) C34 agmatinyltransferase TiaS